MKFHGTCLFLATATVLFARSAVAQPHRPAQAGEIELQAVEKRLSPQDAAIQYFKRFAEDLDKASAGTALKPPPIGANEMLYLDALYLFCTVRKGTCPAILDAILETDIASSFADNTPACPNMKLFWRLWIDNNFQRQQDYQVPTGFIREAMAFKQKELPRYLSCAETVSTELQSAAGKPLSQVLKQRYAADAPARQAVKETLGILQAVKQKNIDVFASSGVTLKSAETAGGAAPKKAKPGGRGGRRK